MDTFTQTSTNSVPSSSQRPVTKPSFVMPPNGRQNASIARFRTEALTGVPSFQVVGMSVVNFIASGLPDRRRLIWDIAYASIYAGTLQTSGRMPDYGLS